MVIKSLVNRHAYNLLKNQNSYTFLKYFLLDTMLIILMSVSNEAGLVHVNNQ